MFTRFKSTPAHVGAGHDAIAGRRHAWRDARVGCRLRRHQRHLRRKHRTSDQQCPLPLTKDRARPCSALQYVVRTRNSAPRAA